MHYVLYKAQNFRCDLYFQHYLRRFTSNKLKDSNLFLAYFFRIAVIFTSVFLFRGEEQKDVTASKRTKSRGVGLCKSKRTDKTDDLK